MPWDSVITIAGIVGTLVAVAGAIGAFISTAAATKTTEPISRLLDETRDANRVNQIHIRLNDFSQIRANGQVVPYRVRKPQAEPSKGEHALENGAPESEVQAREAVLSAAERRAHMWSTLEKLILAYHDQALTQANIQFWFSIIAAAVGFVFIVFMVASGGTLDQEVVFRVVPGAIIDGIATLFLKQASDTRRRATELYDRLRDDKKQGDALDLVDTILDEHIRSTVKAQMALHLAGIGEPHMESIMQRPSRLSEVAVRSEGSGIASTALTRETAS